MANEFTIPETLIVGSKAAFGELERLTIDIANEIEAVNDTGSASIAIYSDNAEFDTASYNFSTGTSNAVANIEYEHFAIEMRLVIDGTPELSIDASGGTTITTIAADMVITGDLTVNGTTTTVSSENLIITDNVILLNKDEMGAGITLGAAGIEIERGSETNAGWFYDEANDWWGPTGPNGIIGLGGAVQTIGNISVIDSTDSAEELLTITGTGAIKIPAGTTLKRPTGVNGMVRYNSDDDDLEAFVAGEWEKFFVTSGGTISGDLTMDTGAQLFIDDGTALDPGLAFANDTDTGIFLSGSDSIGFTAGNSELLQIGPTNITAFTTLDMNNNALTSPLDPVDDTGVGDQGFNDIRYVEIAGDTMTGKLTVNNGAAEGLTIERTTNGTAIGLILDKASVVSDLICLDFTMEDDATARIDYGRICTEIVSNTAGSTEGKMRFRLQDGLGSLVTAAILNADGIMEVTATAALYSDLAERYAADMDLEPGTVVVFGGETEITMSYLMEDTAVAGVISTAPAFRMNSEAGKDKTHPYVALKGRVPCKVTGPVKKGDLLVTATLRGHAMSVGKRTQPYTAFARALENFSGGTGVIEVAII